MARKAKWSHVKVADQFGTLVEAKVWREDDTGFWEAIREWASGYEGVTVTINGRNVYFPLAGPGGSEGGTG